MVTVDTSVDTTIKESWQTRLSNTTKVVPPLLAIDPANKYIYLTYTTTMEAIQYNMNNRELKYVNGDPKFVGYNGVATHPSQGRVWMFSLPPLTKRPEEISTHILETNHKMYTPSVDQVPNGIVLQDVGRFMGETMYVLGYQPQEIEGHTKLYAIENYFLWGLSLGAVIGISVAVGVTLLFLLLCGFCALYKCCTHTSQEESKQLLGAGSVSGLA